MYSFEVALWDAGVHWEIGIWISCVDGDVNAIELSLLLEML